MAKAINRSGGTPAQQPGAEKEKAPTQIDTTLKPFWVSWWSEKLAFELHSPWWITGESHDGRKTVCAAVMASDQATALNTLLEAHDNPLDFEIRFSEEKPIGWSPFSDRFPRADWMDWPEAANTPAPLGDGDEAQETGNACLIAAAPDLLAACEMALEAFDGMDADQFVPEVAAKLKAMRAAVAKARGKAVQP